MFDGMHEAELLSWLLGAWREDGPPICVIEGFAGVGKTSAAQKARRAWDGPAVLVPATAEGTALESLLFNIAAKLEADGYPVVADAAEGDFRTGVLELLRRDSLVIIDDFESLLAPDTRVPPIDVMDFIADISQLGGRGRLMIVTGQSPAEGPWLDNSAIKTMAPPGHEDAERLLWTLLHDRGLTGEVPRDKLADIVTWLGRNPRAMQAFVACLKVDPLQDLLDIDSEAWELRDRAASPQLVERLERRFLHKTIERLDPPALVLLEFLSIYRRTFTIEAIQSSAPRGVQPEIMKGALTSRFLLGRDRRWYSVNPIARQLSLARLESEPHRKIAAHNQAAVHYVKRVNPTSYRALVRGGADFVEARYHLLQAGRDAEFQDLAANYRGLLLRNSQDISRVPDDPVAAAEMLATLMAALHDLNEGHGRLRAILAELLMIRGRPGDDRLAYRQVGIATRETRDKNSWLLRLRLACKLDSTGAARTVVTQALNLLPPAIAVRVVAAAAEEMYARREDGAALEVVNQGLDSLPIVERLPLYSKAAFILCRQNRQADAISLLVNGYREAGPGMNFGWRLFEQAIFIAFERRDQATIRQAKSMVIEQGMNDHQPALCDVLDYELQGKYELGALLAEKHADYFTVASQGAFCWLVERQADKASALLDKPVFQANKSTWWLRGLIAGCQGSGEIYLEAMSQSYGKELSEEEASDPVLWVRIWDRAPKWIGVFPAFYFPRLPAKLTGLPEDIHRQWDSPVGERYPLDEISLQCNSSNNGYQSGNGASEDEERVRMGDTYNFYGGSQTGVGRKATVRNAEIYNTILPPDTSNAQLIEDLSTLLRDLGNDTQSAEAPDAAAAIEVAITAAEEQDHDGLIAALKRAGRWTLARATEVGTAIAAAALQRALGMN